MKEILLVLEEKKVGLWLDAPNVIELNVDVAWYYMKQYWVDQISVVYMVWYVSRPSCLSLSGLVPVA